MRPSLGFELDLNAGSGRSLVMLAPDLQQQISNLDLKRQTDMFAEIGKYLETSANRRLTQQQEISGAKFRPRQRKVQRLYFKKGLPPQLRTYRHSRRFDYHGKGSGANAFYAGSGSYFTTGTRGGVPYVDVHPHKWAGRYGRLLPDEMLLGFRDRKAIKTEVKAGLEIATGYRGFGGTLASWHNEGRVGSDGVARPRRNWFGIGVNDRKAIDRIIEKHLSSK